jgi:hypothetical protein
MSDTFAHVGKAAVDVVVDLVARRGFLMADLEESNRLLSVQAGRAKVTEGLALIRDNSSPEEAIKFLRETLAAIDGSSKE